MSASNPPQSIQQPICLLQVRIGTASGVKISWDNMEKFPVDIHYDAEELSHKVALEIARTIRSHAAAGTLCRVHSSLVSY